MSEPAASPPRPPDVAAGRVRGSLLVSFIEKYSTLVINVAAIVALSRLLTPAETGLYSVAAGLINIAHGLRDFGLGNYILQQDELNDRRLSGVIGVSLVLGLLLAAVFALGAGGIAAFFGEPRARTVVLVMSLNFLLVAYANLGQARLRREMNFRALMRIGILATLGHAGTSIALAALGFGAVGMACASVVGVMISLGGGYLCFRGHFFLRPSFCEWRRLVAYGSFASGGYMLQALSERIADIVVGRLLGLAAVGFYSRGNSLITLFDQALTGAVNPVALSALAAAKRQAEDLGRPFLRYLGYLTAVAWPVLGLMGLLSLPIIQVAFGSQWLPSVPVARVLCIAGAFVVLGQATVTLLNAVGQVRRLFWVQGIGLPLQIAGLAAGATIDLTAVAWGFTGASVAIAGLALEQARRAAGIGWGSILAMLATSAGLTAATLALPVAIVLTWRLAPDHFWAAGIAAGLAGLASWLAALFASRHPFREEVARAAWLVWRKRIG